MLSFLVNENRNDWDEHIPYVLMAYRATMHKSTNCTPNLLMIGREVNFPIDLMTGASRLELSTPCPIQYVEWVQYAMQKSFETAKKHMQQDPM